jgi:hypothetical protein
VVRQKIEAIEGYADGLVSDTEFTSVPDRGKTLGQMIAIKVHHSRWRETDPRSGWALGEYEENQTAGVLVEVAMAVAIEAGQAFNDALYAQEVFAQVVLIRDIFGNPFRPVAISPEWRTDTAVALARQMYESREFGAMPILADALQDAGCDNDDILNHCRSEGPHVRGCWVVDQILGKE